MRARVRALHRTERSQATPNTARGNSSFLRRSREMRAEVAKPSGAPFRTMSANNRSLRNLPFVLINQQPGERGATILPPSASLPLSQTLPFHFPLSIRASVVRESAKISQPSSENGANEEREKRRRFSIFRNKCGASNSRRSRNRFVGLVYIERDTQILVRQLVAQILVRGALKPAKTLEV